ncbi:unnamed protein product [Polarella glacialis]|nr:unnamed protein product [Polarella glacialis]
MLWAEDVQLESPAPGVMVRTLVGKKTAWRPPELRSPDMPRPHIAIVHAYLVPGSGPLVFEREPGANCVISVFGGDEKTVLLIKGDAGAESPEVPLDASCALVPVKHAGASVQISAKPGGAPAEILILEGAPTRDEVVWQGPFVAASKRELTTMFRKYQEGSLCAPWPWPKSTVTHGSEPRFEDFGKGKIKKEAISPAALAWPADPNLRVGKQLRQTVQLFP